MHTPFNVNAAETLRRCLSSGGMQKS